MSVEGLWLARTTQFDDIGAPPMAPNIIVLETGRLFGGDSSYFQVGHYHFDNGAISGRLRSRTHTLIDGAINVFGMEGLVDYEVDFSGILTGDEIHGRMCPVGNEVVLAVYMKKLAELP